MEPRTACGSGVEVRPGSGFLQTLKRALSAKSASDVELRALTLNVILGTVVVILVSLAVPLLMIRSEYEQEQVVAVSSAPAVAEILREGSASRPAIPVRPVPSFSEIPRLAEELVRQRAEKLRTVRPRPPRRADAAGGPAPADPEPSAAPASHAPAFGVPRSTESP